MGKRQICIERNYVRDDVRIMKHEICTESQNNVVSSVMIPTLYNKKQQKNATGSIFLGTMAHLALQFLIRSIGRQYVSTIRGAEGEKKSYIIKPHVKQEQIKIEKKHAAVLIFALGKKLSFVFIVEKIHTARKLCAMTGAQKRERNCKDLTRMIQRLNI